MAACNHGKLRHAVLVILCVSVTMVTFQVSALMPDTNSQRAQDPEDMSEHSGESDPDVVTLGPPDGSRSLNRRESAPLNTHVDSRDFRFEEKADGQVTVAPTTVAATQIAGTNVPQGASNHSIPVNSTNSGHHVTHDQAKPTPKQKKLSIVSREAVKELFVEYGDGDALKFEAFEHLMENLNIGKLYIGHDVDLHRNRTGEFSEFHEHHNHTRDVEKSHDHDQASHDHDHDQASHDHDHTHDHDRDPPKKDVRRRRADTETDRGQLAQSPVGDSSDSAVVNEINLKKCQTSLELYNLVQPGGSTSSAITRDTFLELCPVLIYQLTTQACRSDSSKPCEELSNHANTPGHQGQYDTDEDGGHDDHSHGDLDDGSEVNTSEKVLKTPKAQVWGYAFLACFIISAVGLASVAVVPIMHRVIYNHLLQFLVALAIGSLTGDALLHLIPHAMKPHAHGPAGSGDHSHHGNDSLTVDSEEHSKEAIWIGLVAIGGLYFFFLMERIMGIITKKRTDKNRQKRKKKQLMSPHPSNGPELDSHIGAKLSAHSDTKSCEEVLMVVHSHKGVKGMAVEAHEEVHQNCDPEVKDSWAPGHSHGNVGGHHHSHDVPGSVSAVAWMVIMGDGLHNFSDGLAIGAAFAESLTSGLSTSVAVFCHELPHELGDFAVLLRAGMSVKQALVYNCVSSILCLAGMVIGIIIGNMASASQWIFAMIAGMFIYIALVDMLPEITNVSPRDGENPGLHLLLQNAGIITGATIMLLIALYEDKIRIPITH